MTSENVQILRDKLFDNFRLYCFIREDKNLVIRDFPVYLPVYKRLSDLVVKSNSDLELSGLATMQRMQPGVELKCHTDQDTDPSICYATILYLNDEYADGELFFKHIDLQIKPKKGSLVVFNGRTRHMVPEITSDKIRMSFASNLIYKRC